MTDPSTIEEVSESHRIADSDLAVSFADPDRHDLPLIYVNDAFCELTGYPRERCIDRNCRFLQGEATDPESVARVRAGIEAEGFRLTKLVNYRSDGEAFDNALLVGPVRNLVGDLKLFFGMQWNLTGTLARRESPAPGQWRGERFETQLRRYEATVGRVYELSVEQGDEAVGPALVERLIAMSRTQQYPPVEWVPNWTRGDHLLRYLIEPYGSALGDRVACEGGTDILAADVFTPLALAVHEFARRFLALADIVEDVPRVTLVSDTSGHGGEPFCELLWRESRPFEVPDDVDEAGSVGRGRSLGHGLELVRDIVGRVGGRLDVGASPDGAFEARLSVPNRAYEADEADSAVPG